MTLTPEAAELVSQHGYSHAVTVDPTKALHSAQRAYDAHVMRAPGVTQTDAQEDVLSVELLAMRITRLARDAERFRKSASSHFTTPDAPAMTARVLAETLADSMGAGAEWSALLFATVDAETV